ALFGVLASVGVIPVENDGLYTVNVPNAPFKVAFRFQGGYAYATVLNTPDAEKALAKNKIYAPQQLFTANDASLVSMTWNLDAIPNVLKQKALDHIDEFLRRETQKIENDPAPEKEVKLTVLTELAKKAQMLVADALTLRVQVDFDRTKE